MSRYRDSAQYWRNRADEVRAIRDATIGEEPRRILAKIAAEYDDFRDLALTQRQQAIDLNAKKALP
jgi:hypothetical protein